jgi:type I restriction enzyme S subunit
MVACIAGSVESIGRAALTDRNVAFNQQINAIQPKKDVNPLFLYVLLKISKAYIQSHASKGMKKILTKGDFEKITMIKPPVELQNQFATIVEKVDSLKARYQQSLADLESLYGALSQKAFKGELDLSRVPLPVEATTEDTDSTEELNRETHERRENLASMSV